VAEHVYLVGMMGAGKSTIGPLVAGRLGRRFVDTDALVEDEAGATVGQVFATQGEPAFRAIERAVVAEAGGTGPPAVVAVGGGAVLDERNCEVMRRGRAVVWLRARPATLAARVDDGPVRPLLAEPGGAGPEAVLERLSAERAPRYATLATMTVDVDGRTPEDVADEIVAALGPGA